MELGAMSVIGGVRIKHKASVCVEFDLVFVVVRGQFRPSGLRFEFSRVNPEQPWPK